MDSKSFPASLKPLAYSRWSYHRKKIEARRLIEKPNSCMVIYIIKSKGHSAYKIGRTTERGERFKQLTHEYGEIEIVHLIYSTDPNFEQELHKIFRYQRVKVKNSREWFSLSQDDIDWLKTLEFIGGKRMEKKFTDIIGYMLRQGNRS